MKKVRGNGGKVGGKEEMKGGCENVIGKGTSRNGAKRDDSLRSETGGVER